MSVPAKRYLACLAGVVLIAAGPALSFDNAPGDDAPPPGEIRFRGRNRLFKANGSFRRWKFTRCEINGDEPVESVIEIEIDVASLDTGIKRRDKHLRGEDFFEVTRYPTACLKIYGARRAPGEESFYNAKLDLTIHGIMKTFDIVFEAVTLEPLHVRGEFVIRRTDFRVGKPYSRLNPMSVREEIPITFTAMPPNGLKMTE